MTAKYDLDELNRHFLYLERLASGGINSVVLPSLGDTYRAVADILGGYDSITSQAQLNAITRAINEAVESNAGWATLTQEDLIPLAEYESEWNTAMQAAATSEAISNPSQAQLLNAINNARMVLESGQRADVGLWADFVKSNTDNHAEQINNIVQRGFIRGETVSSMRKQIKTVSDGLLRREAETLARTGYIHYASQAAETVTAANADVLEEYYYVVTFDSRTSNVCKGVTQYNKKGKRFKVGDSKAPLPPLHYGCRTRRIAVPKGFELDGKRAAVGGRKGQEVAELASERQSRKRKGNIKYRGKKDSDIFAPGQVDASETADSWFKRQPLWWLKLNMGDTRARLVKNGGLNIGSLTDAKLRPLTLKELREIHPAVFKKVGI